jgi:hypothetical protein
VLSLLHKFAASIVMVQLVVLVAGLLLIAESEASDVADRSALQGFLSKYGPVGSDASKSSISDYDKFITPNLNRVKQDFDLTNIADGEEKPAAQKLVANNSNNSISLSAIGIGLFSLATMLGARLWRLGHNMPMNTNVMVEHTSGEPEGPSATVVAKTAAKAAGAAALGTSLAFSSAPAFAAPGDTIQRTAPVERKSAADESSTVQLRYSYQNMPWENLETSTAKFAPKTDWATLYPEKRVRLEKKSPVARRDLAPAGNFATYAKTYPGLYSALSGLPMGEVPPLKGPAPKTEE